MKCLIPGTLMVLLSAVPATPGDPEGKKLVKLPIEVHALSVAKIEPGPGASSSLVPGVLAGLTLHCFLSANQRVIIRVEKRSSRLKSLKDDRGTDLMPKGDDRRSGTFWWIRRAEDGRSIRFCIRSARAVPASEATKVTASAELVLVCGLDPKTDERKGVPLRKGTAVNVGPLKMTIARVTDLTADADNEKDPSAIPAHFRMKGAKMAFRLTTGTEPKGSYMDCIQKVTLLDAEGKEITAKAHTSTYGGKAYMQEYDLARKVDKLTMRITWFGKIETITVPVEVSAGLGL